MQLNDWAKFRANIDTALLHRFFLQKNVQWSSMASTVRPHPTSLYY